MSDAGRKMDVEDVLSSIRRLVSEEARTVTNEIVANKMVKKPAEPVAEVQVVVPEKLVLTPAFRVPETQVPARAEEIFQAPVSQEAPPEPETFFQPEQKDAPFAEVLDQDPEHEDAPLEAEISKFTSVAVESKEPDLVPAPIDDITDREPFAEAVETLAEPDFSEPEALHHPEIQQPNIEEPSIADDVPPPLGPEIEEDAEETAAFGYDEVDYTADSDTFLDEEALRELVSEMVRSELQGELGDRITRNVRKLVRREIHRALASRDFE